MRANELLVKKQVNEQRTREGLPALQDERNGRMAYDPFAEDERLASGSVSASAKVCRVYNLGG
jgi:hypothetical protein